MFRIGRQHPRDVDQVGDHRGGRRLGAGALAVIERRADRVALDQHRVHRALDVGDQPFRRNQRRMHAQLDAFGRAPGDTEQLDAIAELFGVLDVDRIEPADPLDVGVLELHRIAEGDRAHDRHLVRRVDAFDVEGRVGLGIPQALRLGQHGGERQALAAHLGEDEIRRPIDDPGDPLDAVGRQPFAQRLDDRDAAGDRRLEGHRHALPLRGGEDLVAVPGEERLVGRHHVLAVGDGFEHQILGKAASADQFDHDVDLAVAGHGKGVASQPATPAGHFLRTGKIRIGHHVDRNRPARAPGDLVGVALQHPESPAPDGANAEQPCLDRFHLNAFLKLYEEMTIFSRK